MTSKHTRSFAAMGAMLLVGLMGCSDDAARPPDSALARWSYEGSEGPDRWGMLDEAYRLCTEGRAQSPVDLGDAQRVDIPDLVAEHRRAAVRIVDNGHSVQASVTGDAGGILVEAQRFELVQMHFHAPSEHMVDGDLAEAEIHFVHRDAQGELAVVGLLVVEGVSAPPAWEPYLTAIESGPGVESVTELDWSALLPADLRTRRYLGSLTTPPCTEGVSWLVLEERLQMTPAQLDTLRSAHEGNRRPVQDLAGRVVGLDASEA